LPPRQVGSRICDTTQEYWWFQSSLGCFSAKRELLKLCVETLTFCVHTFEKTKRNGHKHGNENQKIKPWNCFPLLFEELSTVNLSRLSLVFLLRSLKKLKVAH
jgi:hypothetical protein